MIKYQFDYKEKIQNLDYQSLLKERDSLINDIHYFENFGNFINSQYTVIPSLELIYSLNLHYLAIVCERISEVYSIPK
jgi:hypothetical protein